MQWSKLRSHLRSFVAPELRKRVDFHLINYRKLSELANEFLITVDGQKVFSASTTRHNIEQYQLARLTGLITYGTGEGAKMAEDILTRHEVHTPEDITSSIRTFFDLDPRISLNSSDPILRAFAMIDRRIGRRTLTGMKLADDEHSLVKMLYALRMEYNK